MDCERDRVTGAGAYVETTPDAALGAGLPTPGGRPNVLQPGHISLHGVMTVAHSELEPRPLLASASRAGRAEKVADDIGGVAIAGFEEVGVHVQRRC